MSWSDQLMHYQEIDQELQGINERLLEINKKLQDQAVLTDAQKNAEHKETMAKAAQRAQKELEFEFEKIQKKRKETDNKLYSGRVTNSRELQDLQTELQSLKRRESEMEDELLEAMMERETAELAANEAREQHQKAGAEWESEHQSMLEEQKWLQNRGKELIEEAHSLKKDIPTTILDSYDYLKKRIGNIPVARLKGDVCSVCGIDVTKPTQQKVHHEEEAYCDGCRRLLIP